MADGHRHETQSYDTLWHRSNDGAAGLALSLSRVKTAAGDELRAMNVKNGWVNLVRLPLTGTDRDLQCYHGAQSESGEMELSRVDVHPSDALGVVLSVQEGLRETGHLDRQSLLSVYASDVITGDVPLLTGFVNPPKFLDPPSRYLPVERRQDLSLGPKYMLHRGADSMPAPRD